MGPHTPLSSRGRLASARGRPKLPDMCGRYSLTTPEEALRRLFRYSGPARNLRPRYNIAPGQDVPAVRPDGRGGRELVMLRWGLVPSWAKDSATGNRLINARAETVATRPAFRAAFARRRCLIPASAFYEWRAAARPAKNTGRQPWAVALRGRATFAFAGLWERWKSGAGDALESCAIIVTDANERLRGIHDRMPVILAPEEYQAWLDAVGTAPAMAARLLDPYPASAMEAWPVSTRVNRPQNDEPACLVPVEEGQGNLF